MKNMKNMYNITKFANAVSAQDIASAIQQVIVTIEIGQQYVYGKQIRPRTYFTSDKYGIQNNSFIDQKSGKTYMFNQLGVAVDPSIITQVQKQHAIKYKNDKKAIISNLRNQLKNNIDDILSRTFKQQYQKLIEILNTVDPTSNSKNSQNSFGGNYADVILSIYKFEKHVSKQFFEQIKEKFLDVQRCKRKFEMANLPFPNMSKIRSIGDLAKFCGYFRSLDEAITLTVQQLKYHRIFKDGVEIITTRQDGTRNVQKYIDHTNLIVWLLRISQIQGVKVYQDRTSIRKTLSDYIKLVENGKIKINRQIKDNTYKQIQEKVASFQVNLPQIQPTPQAATILHILKPEAESGIYKMYKTVDPELAKELGQGSTWCTRRSMGNHSYAKTYIQKQGCIYIVTRDNKVILQMLPTMSQFMDINNRNVSSKIFQWADQDLKNVLVPYFKRVAAQGMIIDQLGSPGNVQMGNNYRKIIKQFIPNSVHKVDEFHQQVQQIANDRLQAGNSDYALKIINSFIPSKRKQFTYKLIGCLIKQQQYGGAIELAIRNNIPLARYTQQFNQSYLIAMNRGMKSITGLMYDITKIFKQNKIPINQQLLQKMRDTILFQLDSHAVMQSKQTQAYLKAFTYLGLDMAPMKQKIEDIIQQQLQITNIYTFSKLVTRDIMQIIQICRKYNVNISPLSMKQPILRQIKKFSIGNNGTLAGDPLIRLVVFVINRPLFGISKQNILTMINKNLYPHYYQQIQNLVPQQSNKVLASLNWYKKVINA